MRVEELFTVEGTGKEAFTEMARMVESIRLGTPLSNGRCLKDELTASEKEEVETYVLKKLMPEAANWNFHMTEKHCFTSCL